MLDVVLYLTTQRLSHLVGLRSVPYFINGAQIPTDVRNIVFDRVLDPRNLRNAGLETAFAHRQQYMGYHYFIRIINFVPKKVFCTLTSDATDGLNDPNQYLCDLARTVKCIVEKIKSLAADQDQRIHCLVAVKRVSQVLYQGKDDFRVVLLGGGLDSGMADFGLRVVQQFNQKGSVFLR